MFQNEATVAKKNKKRRKQQKWAIFSTPEIQGIHHASDKGIVNCIPYSGYQKNHTGRYWRNAHNICIKVEDKASNQTETKALTHPIPEI